MYPPSPLFDTAVPDVPSIGAILRTYLVVGAVPFVLWAGANPLSLAVGMSAGGLGLLGLLRLLARRGTGRIRVPGTHLRIEIDRRGHSERI